MLSGPSEKIISSNDFGDVDKIRFLEPAQRLQKYEAFVKELTARVLSVDVALVTSDVSLIDLGLDSANVQTIISAMERSTSFSLSAVRLLSGEVTVTFFARVLDDCAREMAD